MTFNHLKFPFVYFLFCKYYISIFIILKRSQNLLSQLPKLLKFYNNLPKLAGTYLILVISYKFLQVLVNFALIQKSSNQRVCLHQNHSIAPKKIIRILLEFLARNYTYLQDHARSYQKYLTKSCTLF